MHSINKIYEIIDKIHSLENEINFIKNTKLSNYVLSKKFKMLYTSYKFTINIINMYPNYYIDIRDVCSNNNDDIERYNSDHYKFINKLITFSKKIKSVIKLAHEIDLINNFQYKLLVSINKNINNVFKLDNMIVNLYKENNYIRLTNNEIEFFFIMLDIIIIKLKFNNLDNILVNNFKILDYNIYLDLLIELKIQLEKVII
jgi:hypothetical protein